MFVPTIAFAATYLLTSWGILPVTYLTVPWTTPPILSGFLLGGDVSYYADDEHTGMQQADLEMPWYQLSAGAQTYMVGLRKEMEQQLNDFELPDKKPLFGKREYKELPLTRWLREKRESCFLCNKVSYNMNRYYATFFHLIKDESFRVRVDNSKGMCLCHMEKLLEAADEHLHNSQREWFYSSLANLKRKNFARVQEDLDWFIEKFDYRNASADWKNSRDAVSRTMQKLAGIYPADPVFKEN
jgi:hypothetical protein